MTHTTKTIAATIFVITLLPGLSFAATIFFEDQYSATSNASHTVSVYLDTEGESINSLEGKIIFPNLGKIFEVSDGNTALNFWVQKPTPSLHSVTFAGITPGGIYDKKSFLFSVLVQGEGEVTATNMRTLKNDGLGTEVKTTVSSLVLRGNKKTSTEGNQETSDIDPPENFVPLIGRDEGLFGNKYFVAFATQDKGSGMDHFEIKEGWLGKYTEGTSPFVLEHQELDRKIFVKAIDKSHHSRVATVGNWKISLWQKACLIVMIILLSLFLVSLKRKWSKPAK